MMQACLLTSLSASAPEDEERSGNHLAQLEAGTGTSKTVPYCLAAIIAAATEALQEQLVHKDLPRLAAIILD